MARADLVSSVDNFTYSVNGGSFAEVLDYRTLMDDDDTTVSFTAGILWRPVSHVGIGLVYRDGPEFDLSEEIQQDGVGAKALREEMYELGRATELGRVPFNFSVPELLRHRGVLRSVPERLSGRRARDHG